MSTVDLPPDLHTIRAADLWRHGVKLRVSCSCGRVTTLDSWVIAKHMGDEWRYAEGRLNPLKSRLRCSRCGRVDATIELISST